MRRRPKLIETASHQEFEFDYNHNVVYFKGRVIHLSPHEADILHVLLSNRARATPLGVLIQRVYASGEPNTAAVSIRVSIHSLRKKLHETGIKIRAEARVGYEIDAAVLPELNRRLTDKILLALNMAEATGERETAAHLRAALDAAETQRRRWIADGGMLQPSNAVAHEEEAERPA